MSRTGVVLSSLLQKKAHLRFIWFWRYSLLGPNSVYQGSLCSHDCGLCGLCCGGSVVLHGPRWRMGKTQQPMCGLLCIGSHWLLRGETLTAHSGSVREIQLICSDVIRICFHYVPTGSLQVSEMKGHWCRAVIFLQVKLGQSLGIFFSCPKGLSQWLWSYW